MCQISEGGVEIEAKNPRIMKSCMKCDQPATVVARIKDPMCGDCFHAYFTHRFRATFGKSKAVRTGDKVLIAFSGGQSSCAMLHLVKEGLAEGVHKKLRYIPGIIFVDESICLDQDEGEHSKQLEEIKAWLKESTFPAYMTRLEEVMSDCDPDVREVSCDQSGDTDGAPGDPACRERFLELWSSTSTLTAKEDLQRTLRLELLKQVALKLGYAKVMFGDSATRLAAGILGDLAKGRGASVFQGMCFIDRRDEEVSVLRPMREFTSREISLFNHQCGLQSVFIPSVSTKAGQLASINLLTQEFVNGLQSDFPATVSTVMKTGAKLTSDMMAGDASTTCLFCQSPLDADPPPPCSASAATQYSQGLQRLSVDGKTKEGCAGTSTGTTDTSCCGQGDGSCQSTINTAQMTPDDLSSFLCYGCRVLVRDVKNPNALPAPWIAEFGRRRRREEMRSEIADFLLEDGSGDVDDR